MSSNEARLLQQQQQQNEEDGPLDASPEQIGEHVQGILSEDPDRQLASARTLRRFLSVEHSRPVDQVVDAGAVPRLVEFLRREDQPRLQHEAARALTEIASVNSRHTRVLTDAGAVPALINLLSSPDAGVVEQAALALGTIAGERTHSRDHVLEQGALEPLLGCLNELTSPDVLRTATWAVSRLCCVRPPPSLETIRPAVPHLVRLLWAPDALVVGHVCQALQNIVDRSNDCIQAVIEEGAVPQLVRLLMHEMPYVQIAALEAVGNIATGDDLQTQTLINAGVLHLLANLLQHPQERIRKETCWVLSNITAGTIEQIQAVVDAGIIPMLMQLLGATSFAVQQEAVLALSNAAANGTPEQIALMAAHGMIRRFCALLDPFSRSSNPQVILAMEDALEAILRAGQQPGAQRDGRNVYADAIEECGGLDILEQLQIHPSQDVYARAVRILETYFQAVEDAELQPQLDADVAMDDGQ